MESISLLLAAGAFALWQYRELRRTQRVRRMIARVEEFSPRPRRVESIGCGLPYCGRGAGRV